MRLHRSLQKRARKVDPIEIANLADKYLAGCGVYKRELERARGLVGVLKIKTSMQKIDELEREIAKLETKIERLYERQCEQAAVLEDDLLYNHSVLKEWLLPDEYKDFQQG